MLFLCYLYVILYIRGRSPIYIFLTLGGFSMILIVLNIICILSSVWFFYRFIVKGESPIPFLMSCIMLSLFSIVWAISFIKQ